MHELDANATGVNAACSVSRSARDVQFGMREGSEMPSGSRSACRYPQRRNASITRSCFSVSTFINTVDKNEWVSQPHSAIPGRRGVCLNNNNSYRFPAGQTDVAAGSGGELERRPND